MLSRSVGHAHPAPLSLSRPFNHTASVDYSAPMQPTRLGGRGARQCGGRRWGENDRLLAPRACRFTPLSHSGSRSSMYASSSSAVVAAADTSPKSSPEFSSSPSESATGPGAGATPGSSASSHSSSKTTSIPPRTVQNRSCKNQRQERTHSSLSGQPPRFDHPSIGASWQQKTGETLGNPKDGSV